MFYYFNTVRALTLCALLSCASTSVAVSPAPDVLRVERVAVEVEEAEDGYGNVVTATNPIAVDIVATRWIGRALDPVLEVDGRQFRKYVHPGPGLIRFVLADAAWLDDAQVIAIQYGDDLNSRAPLSIDPPSRP